MAMTDGCGSCMKYFFGFLNLILFTLGATMLGVGVYALTGDTAQLNSLINSNLYSGSAVVLIIAGSIVTAVSFLGCCGALTESKCLLTLFFIVVLILFAVCIAGVVTGYKLGSEKILNTIESEIDSSLEKYNKDKAVKGAWDFMQTYFQCCGSTDGGDFSKKGITPLPQSCCKKDKNGAFMDCAKKHTEDNSYYNKGCKSLARDFFAGKSKLFGGCAIGLLVFLFLSLVFSCTIRQSIV